MDFGILSEVNRLKDYAGPIFTWGVFCCCCKTVGGEGINKPLRSAPLQGITI